jgi:hypothetical protein
VALVPVVGVELAAAEEEERVRQQRELYHTAPALTQAVVSARMKVIGRRAVEPENPIVAWAVRIPELTMLEHEEAPVVLP